MRFSCTWLAPTVGRVLEHASFFGAPPAAQQELGSWRRIRHSQQEPTDHGEPHCSVPVMFRGCVGDVHVGRRDVMNRRGDWRLRRGERRRMGQVGLRAFSRRPHTGSWSIWQSMQRCSTWRRAGELLYSKHTALPRHTHAAPMPPSGSAEKPKKPGPPPRALNDKAEYRRYSAAREVHTPTSAELNGDRVTPHVYRVNGVHPLIDIAPSSKAVTPEVARYRLWVMVRRWARRHMSPSRLVSASESIRRCQCNLLRESPPHWTAVRIRSRRSPPTPNPPSTMTVDPRSTPRNADSTAVTTWRTTRRQSVVAHRF
ncbi:hypothetical protein OF83DRAFT_1135645, partial [Amylostereum chailletii]